MYCFGSHTRHRNEFDQRFRSVPNYLYTCQSSMHFDSTKKKFHKLRIKEKKGKNYLKGKSQDSNHIFIHLCGKKWKLMGNNRKNADDWKLN